MIGKLLVAIIVSAAGLILSPSAQACRDCPFPMKIGDNQWLMPDSNMVVGIYESEIGDTMAVVVELRDSSSRTLIAQGMGYRTKKQKTLTLTLKDRKGRKVRAKIHWVDSENTVIQAKFECDGDLRCDIEDH